MATDFNCTLCGAYFRVENVGDVMKFLGPHWTEIHQRTAFKSTRTAYVCPVKGCAYSRMGPPITPRELISHLVKKHQWPEPKNSHYDTIVMQMKKGCNPTSLSTLAAAAPVVKQEVAARVLTGAPLPYLGPPSPPPDAAPLTAPRFPGASQPASLANFNRCFPVLLSASEPSARAAFPRPTTMLVPPVQAYLAAPRFPTASQPADSELVDDDFINRHLPSRSDPNISDCGLRFLNPNLVKEHASRCHICRIFPQDA